MYDPVVHCSRGCCFTASREMGDYGEDKGISDRASTIILHIIAIKAIAES